MVSRERGLRLLAWTGPVSILLVLVGWLAAGFFPPPRPDLTGEAVQDLWANRTTLKQLAMILCLWGGSLYAPFTAAVYMGLRSAGDHVLNAGQAACGIFGTVFFSLNFFVLSMVPFRAGGDTGASVQVLHDLGFAMTFTPVPPFTVQYLLIAAVILRDRSERPAFPRWIGYVNIWVGVGLIPASLIPLFHSGPLAWNGLASFWVPVAVFVGWFVVMSVPMIRRPDGSSGEER